MRLWKNSAKRKKDERNESLIGLKRLRYKLARREDFDAAIFA